MTEAPPARGAHGLTRGSPCPRSRDIEVRSRREYARSAQRAPGSTDPARAARARAPGADYDDPTIGRERHGRSASEQATNGIRKRQPFSEGHCALRASLILPYARLRPRSVSARCDDRDDHARLSLLAHARFRVELPRTTRASATRALSRRTASTASAAQRPGLHVLGLLSNACHCGFEARSVTDEIQH